MQLSNQAQCSVVLWAHINNILGNFIQIKSKFKSPQFRMNDIILDTG